MGIRSFDDWVTSSGLRERSQMKQLANATVAIEAEHYLERLMTTPPTKEQLLSAIGGLPFALRSTVANHVEIWRSSGITPYFVFSGIDGYKQDDPVAFAEENERINDEAWRMYEHQQPQEAVNTFGRSGSVKPKHIARYLQLILRELGVTFLVAPYSAWAQLVYLENRTNGAFDAIFGAPECFLFDANKVIMEWDFVAREFFWVRRRDLLENLGNVHQDLLIDALLLSGSSLLPTIPVVLQNRKQFTVKAVRDLMIVGTPKNGYQICQNFEEDAQMRRLNYLERYRKARTAIKHHCIVTTDGRTEILNVAGTPGNMHEVMGQRLPEELYTYLTKGLVGPRLLQHRVFAEILVLPPLAGGEYDAYRNLVSEKLNETRQSALALLSYSLHRFFQHKNVSIRCWFDGDNTEASRSLSVIEHGDPRVTVGTFNIKSDNFVSATRQCTKSGLLGIVTLSLNDEDFVKRSVVRRDLSNVALLAHKDEVLFNSLWRVLRLRNYVDAQHRLTQWGKVLYAAMAALDGRDARLEESVFLAVELLRLDLLTADNFFPEYRGVPFRGSDTDKRNTVLVSRVACLHQLGHKSIGFTGPLSRGLLAYHSMICAVREALRDLTEATIATLFMNGDAERNRNDYTEMGLDLPFLRDNDCSLGIAVASYLDELVSRPDSRSAEVKTAVRDKGPKEWFPHGIDFFGDLDTAFNLWGAVYEGVKVGGNLVKQRTVWDEVNDWLTGLR